MKNYSRVVRPIKIVEDVHQDRYWQQPQVDLPFQSSLHLRAIFRGHGLDYLRWSESIVRAPWRTFLVVRRGCGITAS